MTAKRTIWSVCVAAVGAIVLALMFSGGLAFFETWLVRAFEANDIQNVVSDYYDALQVGNYSAALSMLSPDLLQARGTNFEKKLRDNRVEFDSVAVKLDPEESRAHTASVAITDMLLRSARTGCEQWRGDFRLKKSGGWWILGGKWLIDRIPSQAWTDGFKCDERALRRSWAGQRADVGIPEDRASLPAWARGHLERLDPLRVEATSTETATASVSWAPTKAVDYEGSAAGDERAKATSWKSAPNASRPVILTFTFPQIVRLARIRMSNGVLEPDGTRGNAFYNNGRIDSMTVIGDAGAVHSEVGVDVPSQSPNLTNLDCDYGSVKTVQLRIDRVVRGRPDAALREIQFWGLPTGHAFPAAAPIQMISSTHAPERAERWGQCDPPSEVTPIPEAALP